MKTIAEQQEKLLQVSDKLAGLEKEIEAMKATVTKAELIADNMKDIESKFKTLNREVSELWQGLDYVSNPLK